MKQTTARARLRSAITRVRRGRASRGCRYDADLRRQIVAYAAAQRSKGVSLCSTAAALGLSYQTLLRRVLLSPSEDALFDGVEGDTLWKTRYYHNHLGRVFSIDVFEGELEGLSLCEIEANSLEELMKAEPPKYAIREVTADLFFTGGSLCRATRADVMSVLAS